MSAIEQMLTSHRLVGGIVYDATMAGDWSLLSQFDPQHCAPIFRVPERIVAYHYVRSGTLTVCIRGQEPLVASAGTMVLFPRNDPHVICSSANVPPTPAEKVFTSDGKNGANVVRIEGEGPECALFCGWLGVDEGNEALLRALPAVLMANVSDAQGAFIASSLRYAAEEIGDKPELVARLSQLFFEESIRCYLENVPEAEGRRLAALRDPALARALAMIDRSLSEEITLEVLAKEAGVSRTVLAERFAAAFDESPMRYVARQRMRNAATLLSAGNMTVAEVAFAVGFSSEAAFARAFKREYGAPPAAWRAKAA
jgi:AraC family transcriptional regulator, alkane utilization regulator